MKFIFLIPLVAFCVPVFAQWYSIESGTSGKLYEVEFINESIGFIAGTTGILKTINQGDSWNTTSQTVSTSDISFSSDLIGYCIQNNNILKTTNQGDSWSVVSSFNNLSLNSVHFVSDNIGYIAAHATGPVESYIMKTVDGGITWDIDSFPNIQTLQDIQFIDMIQDLYVGMVAKLSKHIMEELHGKLSKVKISKH